MSFLYFAVPTLNHVLMFTVLFLAITKYCIEKYVCVPTILLLVCSIRIQFSHIMFIASL